MKFYIATDHAGIDLKDFTVETLRSKGHEVIDLGPFDKDQCRLSRLCDQSV
jgi:ribose 5-phosphate isomerase B